MGGGSFLARVTWRSKRLGDTALAAAVFALSLGLLAAGGSDLRHGSGLDAPATLLTALASLPLVARRAAPLAVFVLTAVASAGLRAIDEPAGPPLGPTGAPCFVAA